MATVLDPGSKILIYILFSEVSHTVNLPLFNTKDNELAKKKKKWIIIVLFSFGILKIKIQLALLPLFMTK